MSILIVLAKSPVAGRVKTRLCPPLSGEQAADIALAALQDTLRAVAAIQVDHRMLVLDGEPGDWVPEGFSVLPQQTGLLDQRLIDAFADVFAHVGQPSLGSEASWARRVNMSGTNDLPTADLAGLADSDDMSNKQFLGGSGGIAVERGEPCVLIAMDTPQVHPRQLSEALAHLADADSVIGMAEDGGFWLIGLNAPDPEVFRDIPMSVDFTGAAQLDRLASLGHRTVAVESLRDIDTFADLDAVAAEFPDLAVSHVWIAMQRALTNR
jgi:uncharacterized protein